MRAEFVAGFTTADTIAPVTLEISPAPATAGASIYTPIRILFNEAIDPAKFRAAADTGAVVGSRPGGGAPRFPVRQHRGGLHAEPAAGPGGRVPRAVAGGGGSLFERPNPGARLHLHDHERDATVHRSARGRRQRHGHREHGHERDGDRRRIRCRVCRLLPERRFLGDRAGAVRLQLPGGARTRQPGRSDQGVRRLPPTRRAAAARLSAGSCLSRPICRRRRRSWCRRRISTPPTANTSTSAIRATDDVGVAQVSFKAQTGKPLDAATRTIAPAVVDRTEAFGFVVPADAIPGSSIAIQGSVVDTKGQVVDAAPVSVTVRDAVAPTVKITGATSGTQVRAGPADDRRGLRAGRGRYSLDHLQSHRRRGADADAHHRPAADVDRDFVHGLGAGGSSPPQSLVLDATAEDRAGNVGSAARVILPVGDNVPPTITALRTDTGRLQIVRGRSVTIVVDAEDDLGVSEIDLQGQGAFVVSRCEADRRRRLAPRARRSRFRFPRTPCPGRCSTCRPPPSTSPATSARRPR